MLQTESPCRDHFAHSHIDVVGPVLILMIYLTPIVIGKPLIGTMRAQQVFPQGMEKLERRIGDYHTSPHPEPPISLGRLLNREEARARSRGQIWGKGRDSNAVHQCDVCQPMDQIIPTYIN